jgi:hypothetical protein
MIGTLLAIWIGSTLVLLGVIINRWNVATKINKIKNPALAKSLLASAPLPTSAGAAILVVVLLLVMFSPIMLGIMIHDYYIEIREDIYRMTHPEIPNDYQEESDEA